MGKAFIFIFISSIAVFCSCKKNNSCAIPDVTVTASDFEIQSLTDSLEKYRIAGALQHKTGFFYKIENKGTGEQVKDLCSTIVFRYIGSFFDGKIFDISLLDPKKDVPTPLLTDTNLDSLFEASKTSSMALGQTIQGVGDALKLINVGGSIGIYIPPSLGYGSKGVLDDNNNYLIPPNAYLVFHVELVEIK